MTLVELAPAKINLTLAVHGRRLDGYHDLTSIVAFAGAADRVTLEPGDVFSLAVTGPRGAACGSVADNLIGKAAAALSARISGLVTGHFTLSKRLPVAAGIGGGSADAAAALRLLARANGVALNDARLTEAAAICGADVPACLMSRATIAAGIGERLRLVHVPRMAVVLVNPGIALPTAEVFTALGLKPGEAARQAQAPAAERPGARDTKAWLDFLRAHGNDLEPAAIRLRPQIDDVLAALRATKGCGLARMSGSGATCFEFYDSARAAFAAVRILRRAHPGWWVRASVVQ